MVKNLSDNSGDTRDMSSIPGLGRFSGGDEEYRIYDFTMAQIPKQSRVVTQIRIKGTCTDLRMS